MIAEVLREVLRAVVGGGADISAANPLPVDTSPGVKTESTELDMAVIAAAATSTLFDCDAIDLSSGRGTLALTIRTRYNAAATRGILIHVVSSPLNGDAGTHPGAMSLTVMTDPLAHFITNELVGLLIQNVTDGSAGLVTANDETTITVAALAGGLTNRWNPGDDYAIAGGNYDTADWDTWTPFFAADGILRQTKNYEVSPIFLKVLVENLDPAQTVTDVVVVASVGV